jgi:hypothetical protein
VRNTVPPQLRGILETITYASQAVPEVIARDLEFLPDANFCFCSSIQASISRGMPVSAHWSRAFTSLSTSALVFAISPGESVAGCHAGTRGEVYDIQQFSSH